MGVIGTSCRLCNLPLNFDHYVRSPSLGVLKIFRSSAGPAGGHDWEPDERPVHFDPVRHGWLCDAVAVGQGRAVAGPVEDGVIRVGEEVVFVGEYDEPAYHRACHAMFGSPTDHEALLDSTGTYPWAQAETYNGQLFDLRLLVDHGKAWMLEDPRGSERSRVRIEELIAGARRPRSKPATIADVIANDCDWRAHVIHEAEAPRHVVRIRTGIGTGPDCATYPALVWAMKEWGGDGMCDAATLDELETFATTVKATVEADARAVLLMITIGQGQMQLIMHARDEATTRANIEALPQGRVPLEFDNELDPAWKLFFTQLAR